MRHFHLLKLANQFLTLANKLPENTDNLKKILSNIDDLNTFNSRIDYAEKNLKHLSSGSSRIVYLTNKDTVIKLAKNEKGLAQNKAECQSKVKCKYINKILDCSKDYLWVESPFLEKITEKDFEELTGFSFKDFEKMIDSTLESKNSANIKEITKVTKSDFFKEIINAAKNLQLMSGDLTRISSWGTKDNIPILIDSGLNKQVYQKYYKSDSSKSSSS